MFTQSAINVNSTSWTDNLISIFTPYSSLEKRINSIQSEVLTKQNMSDLNRAFKLAQGFCWPAGRIKKLLVNVSPTLIRNFLNNLLKTTNPKDLEKIFSSYLEVLPEQTLLNLAKLENLENAEAWYHSRGLVKNSALKDRLSKEGKALFNEFLVECKYFIYHILDIMAAISGLNEIGPEKHNNLYSNSSKMDSWFAQNKLESYWKLLGYPSVIFATVSLYITLAPLAAGVTALTVSCMVIAIVAYQRYLKPCPKDHDGLKNMTSERFKSKEPTYARQDILRQIESAFAEKKSVLLVGERGSGKSSMARALAESIPEGKVCNFLKDAQLFYGAASQFKSLSPLEPSFRAIKENFKNYSDNVVFFFDEFHSIFKQDGLIGSNAAEEIKTFYENFKYIIGATTTKEYEELIEKHEAIVERRFKVIHMPPLEDDKIETILSQYLQNLHPEITLGKKVVKYIVKKAKEFKPNTSKVDAAQCLLNRAINKVCNTQFTDLEAEIGQLEDEASSLEQSLLHASLSKVTKLSKQLKDTNETIDKLKTKLQRKTQRASKIKKIEDYYLDLKRQSYKLADPKKKLSDNPLLQRKWIILNAKIKLAENFIEHEKLQLKLYPRLDNSLIDVILKDINFKRKVASSTDKKSANSNK